MARSKRVAGRIVHATAIVAAAVVTPATPVKTTATHVAATSVASAATVAATAAMTENGDGGQRNKTDCEETGQTPAPRANWIVLLHSAIDSIPGREFHAAPFLAEA